MTRKPSNVSAGSGIAAGMALAAAALGIAAAGATAFFAGSRCLRSARTESGVARVKEVRDTTGNRVRVLQQGGVYQSATYLDERRFEPVFAYYRAFDRMFDAEAAKRETTGRGIDRVLVMGGGGYAYPKHVLTTHPTIDMDVVEIDPSITRLARRWFFLDELELIAGDRLRLITADARSLIFRAMAEGVRYDAIVNDCFAGHEPVRSLATVEALHQVKACLNPGGLYLANVVTSAGGENVDFLRDAAATAASVFSRVHVVPCEDASFGAEDNYLLIATDGTYAFHDELPLDDAMYGDVMCDARGRTALSRADGPLVQRGLVP